MLLIPFLRTLPKSIAFLLFLIIYSSTCAQSPVDSLLSKSHTEKWAASIEKKANSLEEKLTAKSIRVLDKLQKQEEKIYRKMLKGKDSLQAKAAMLDTREKYRALGDKLKNPLASVKAGQYISKLDSLTTSLKFLESNGIGGKVKDALNQTASLQNKFQQAEEIKKFIRERKDQLKQQLEKLGMVKQLKKFNKEVYYYGQQLNEYKEILKDSRKMERKAIELLSKTKLFKDFFRKNSQLASLFRLPGDPGDPSAQVNIAGLQTRAQVNSLIQQQVGPGSAGQAQFSKNVQSAQSQLNALKDKILKGGGSSSDADLPDFKPNNQKTKSFLNRLEYGTNIQTQKANSFFPVTSDIGVSLGYKLNDKSVIGVGTSFKMGWGTGFQNIRISSQGVGVRSYLDYKIKGSFWISGGFEMNYRSEIREIVQLRDYSGWQQSGLVGISKVVSLKTKFFKKTKLQLLWDFLSHQQVPRVQPLMFRIGYTF